jgi:hypothetical protein
MRVRGAIVRTLRETTLADLVLAPALPATPGQDIPLPGPPALAPPEARALAREV